MKITSRTIDALDNKNEYHIASFVAHAMFSQLEEVQQAIESIEGAEIHAKSEQGKIVFTIEDTSQKNIGRKMDTFKEHKGLLSFSPVYHQYLKEDAEEKNKSEQAENLATQIF